jgi:hypothetical protein
MALTLRSLLSRKEEDQVEGPWLFVDLAPGAYYDVTALMEAASRA